MSAALLGAESIAARHVIARSFATLEQAQGERSIDQALKAIEADLNQLAITAHDYAVWDDAFNFAVTRNPQFVRSNLAAATLGNIRVDFVWMIDAKDADVLALQRWPGHELDPPTNADPRIVAAVRTKLEELREQAPPALGRLFPTEEGLLAVAASPILPTGGRGSPRGTLIFGRFVSADLVARAQTTSQLPLRLYFSSAASATLPASARELWSASMEGSSRTLVPISDTVMSGFVLLRDVNHKPVAIVATRIDRNLMAFGYRTRRTLVGIFSGVVAIFAIVVSALLLHLERTGSARATSERRYRAVITQAQETILLVDTRTRRILEANPAASATLGFATAELTEMDIDELFFACDGDVLKAAQRESHAAAHPDRILLVRCKSNEFIDVEVTASPLIIDEREVTSFVLRDVSRRKRAERQLVDKQHQMVHLAHHDMLTGLLNRLGLERRLPHVIQAAAQRGLHAAFLYIDLDHFKKINDLRGHGCGDKILTMAAERLRQCLSSEDLVVRMGGDEFVVIAGGLREASDSGAIAARVRESLAVPFDVDTQHFKVTASIGVSVYPQDGGDYELLLKNADIALYESKEAGRDTYTLFTGEMTQRVSERLALEVELREALEQGQFYLDYQPLVDPSTQKIASFEALVRWHHPVRGRIPPLQFIGVAERTNLICEIGAYVIREACRQIGEWQMAGADVVPVAVNVSAKQLEQRAIVDLLKEALGSSRISPSLLRIEITESVFMDSSELRVQHLKELRALGLQVSIDDFGTGYSNLAYLKHLPVDCLKIDRAFVRDINSSSADEEIVKAIIRMARSLGLATVAEGVETQEQARRLSELGATYVQGFFFSPPVAADACGRLLGRPTTAAPPTDPMQSMIRRAG